LFVSIALRSQQEALSHEPVVVVAGAQHLPACNAASSLPNSRM
jgi:hypothetical protein